ncbi:RNA polymerase sigma factor [Streptomyces mirabilis]|uniref:RNA polymerase sigma factor n=1 Tax=Streptomyces mirabilis TaxID=68239 RepID=UPI0033AE40FF
MTAVQLPPGEDCGRPPPEGFETFFMRYEPRLRRYLYTLGARDSLLEDAAQMTLEEAFRSWPSLQDHPPQDAWLFKVARQRYAKAYKEHLKLGDLTDPVLFDRLHQDDATAGTGGWICWPCCADFLNSSAKPWCSAGSSRRSRCAVCRGLIVS